jgi:FSR family fosmidomycin resistance protein-like MFS transporter
VQPAASTAPAREAPRRHPSRADRSVLKVATVVACAHAVNDMYASFVPPLLPRIMGELQLSISLAATLAVAYSIASALPQPLFGYLSDRYGRRVFAVAGPVLCGVFVSLIGWAPGFWTLVALLLIGGLGSAAFHPPGASYAVRVTSGRGGGARYSVFAFAGSVGFALGPLVAVGLAQAGGLRGMWVAMAPVLLLAPLVFFALPSGRSEIRAAVGSPPPRPSEVVRRLRGPLGLIFGVSAIMAFVQRVFLTMEPIIVAEAGGTEGHGALLLSTYLASQALGVIAGGMLADRVDRRLLLAHLCFWAVPTHLLAIWIGPDGSLGLLAAAVAGTLGMATLPPIVVMAQELVPSGTGVSSGIVMGLAWGTGSAGVLVTGLLADAVGPAQAAAVSVPVALVAMALALHPALRTVRHAQA